MYVCCRGITQSTLTDNPFIIHLTRSQQTRILSIVPCLLSQSFLLLNNGVEKQLGTHDFQQYQLIGCFPFVDGNGCCDSEEGFEIQIQNLAFKIWCDFELSCPHLQSMKASSTLLTCSKSLIDAGYS